MPGPEENPQPDAQDNAAPEQKPGVAVTAAELVDRYHLAQATLNGAPIMGVLGLVITIMMKGAAGEEGQDLGRQLSIVTTNFVNEARQKKPKGIIMPSSAPGVPNGLGGKRH